MANRAARWISIVFDSSFLSFPIFLAIGWRESGAAGLGWAVLVLLMVTGIPLLYMILGRRIGGVSDFELSRRAERPRFIAVSICSDLLALVLLIFLGGPHLLRVMTLAYLCLGIVMLMISSVWKISLHLAGFSGFATALTFVFGPAALITFVGLPVLAWARWHRRKHTVAQLIAGALVGGLIASLVFGVMGKWL
jgi:phosphotransferase system  glucose/maltose/N-acetylglucosamine-specific IIC component